MQAKNLRDRVQQALIYPAFPAVACTISITIFITYMVPQLTGFMAQNGGALPLPTQILMQVHSSHDFILVGWSDPGRIGVSVGFRAFVRTDEGRINWTGFRSLSFPAMAESSGTGITRAPRARSAPLMENGVPLLRALER